MKQFCRLTAILPAVLLCIFLSSCADVDARLTLSASGVCSLRLHYAVSAMAIALDETSGGRALLPFPVSRSSYSTALQNVPGASLVSYKSSETNRDYIVDAELSFPSMEGLAEFVNSQGTERVQYSAETSGRTLRILLSPGAEPARAAGGMAAAGAAPDPGAAQNASVDPDLGRCIDAAFGPYTVSIVIDLPARARAVQGGRLSDDGREASCSSPAAALAKSAEPQYFELVW